MATDVSPKKGVPPRARPNVRVGIYSSLPSADRAVSKLLEAGFSHEQISVVCSDEARNRHFAEFQHEVRSGKNADSGAVAGAGIGAAVGGLAAIALGAVSGAVPLIIAGAAGVAAGSGAGVFVGAMSSRLEEGEVADFYDQAVREGQILVGVEDNSPEAELRLTEAARIIAEAGAKPLPLTEESPQVS